MQSGNGGEHGAPPLFKPYTNRSMTLRNRFVMAPMTRSRSPGGVPGPSVAEYYRRRASGGVGLIVTEGVGIDHPAALGSSDFDGRDIPVMYGELARAGWQSVIAAVHSAGGKIVPQLWHQGVMRPEGTGPFPDHRSSRPSGVWGPEGRRSPVPPATITKLLPVGLPLTESEIGDIVAAFVRSAAFAKEVGFDGIALHGAHGYLLDTFLWDETNRRADRFGGDHVGRTRFVVDIVKEIRAAIGPDLPIMFRFSQWKQQDLDARLAGTPIELEQILGPLADAGVDIFDASTRNFQHAEFPGSSLNLAGWAKKLTGKASMTVGGVGLDKDIYSSFQGGSQPVGLEALFDRFDRDEFDLVAVGRALIADPDWVAKIRNGEQCSAFDPAMLQEL